MLRAQEEREHQERSKILFLIRNETFWMAQGMARIFTRAIRFGTRGTSMESIRKRTWEGTISKCRIPSRWMVTKQALCSSSPDAFEDGVDLSNRPSSSFASVGDETQVIHRGKLLPSIAGERYRKRERLKTSQEFQHAQKKGQTIHLKYFVINCVSNVHRQEDGIYCTRIGMVVSKKISKKSVVRNQVKRRIRDIFRRNKEKFPKQHDIVFIPRTTVVDAAYEDLEKDVLSWSSCFDPASKTKTYRKTNRDVEKSKPSRRRKTKDPT